MRRGQFGLVIFLLVLSLVVAVVLLIIYLAGRDEPVRAVANDSLNRTFFNITLESNAVTLVSYRLENESDVLLDGRFFPNTREEYRRGIEANTTVLLSAWGVEYYFNQSLCNVTRNNFPCGVRMKEKALDYELFLNESVLVIDPKNRTIQAPVLLCWTYTASIVNIVVPLPMVRVPDDLRWRVDFCHVVEQDITRRVVFPVELRRNPFVYEHNWVVLTVRDTEVVGFAPIGDRNVSVWV